MARIAYMRHIYECKTVKEKEHLNTIHSQLT